MASLGKMVVKKGHSRSVIPLFLTTILNEQLFKYPLAYCIEILADPGRHKGRAFIYAQEKGSFEPSVPWPVHLEDF